MCASIKRFIHVSSSKYKNCNKTKSAPTYILNKICHKEYKLSAHTRYMHTHFENIYPPENTHHIVRMIIFDVINNWAW